MEKIVIEFGNYGAHIGTRYLGVQLRGEIQVQLLADKDVVCDLAGVLSLSETFVEECFGKLLESYSLEDLKRRVTFRNATPTLKMPIYSLYREREKAYRDVEDSIESAKISMGVYGMQAKYQQVLDRREACENRGYHVFSRKSFEDETNDTLICHDCEVFMSKRDIAHVQYQLSEW